MSLNQIIQQEKMEHESEDEQENAIEYFSVSIKKLLFLSFITLGLYELYWFYKNWQAVKKMENSNISPFWRTIFSIFYCYGLFKKILVSAKEKGCTKRYPPGLLALFYIVIQIITGISINDTSIIVAYISGDPLVSYIVWLLVLVLSMIPVCIVQHTANFYNQKICPATDKRRQKCTGGEIVIIIIGIILSSAFFIDLDYKAHSGPEGSTSYFGYLGYLGEWGRYKTSIGEFSVLFPTEPVYDFEDATMIVDTDIIIHNDIYKSPESGSVEYHVASIKFLSDINDLDAEALFDILLARTMAFSEDNKVESFTEVVFNGQRAKDYFIVNNPYNLNVRGRFIFTGRKLYHLMAVNYEGVEGNDDYTKFVDSFEILPEE